MASGTQSRFGLVFRRLLKENGISLYQVAQFSGLDAAYIGRLASGKRRNPTRDTIIKIHLALVHVSKNVSMDDGTELLLSAEWAPLLGRGESVLLK